MGLAHEKKSYLQEKNNLFEIGSIEKISLPSHTSLKLSFLSSCLSLR